MQHAQTSQHKSALADKRVPHPFRHSIVPIKLNSVAHRNPLRPKPTRLLRPVHVDFGKADLLQKTQPQLRILADGNTARGGEAGSGTFYEAQEEAARRIAHRLHDESAQMLATVYLELANIARDCPDSTAHKINLVVKHLDGVREQLRGLSHELSPPVLDQLGLMPALKSLARGVGDRSGLKLVVSGNIPSIPRVVGAVLYRVVQEALSNVVRHARATEAEVTLSLENNKICCTVCDDGVGFMPYGEDVDAVIERGSAPALASGSDGDPVHRPAYGLGLAGIFERVTALQGCCQITGCPMGGMQLKVEIPL